jgi:hypothetical protein
MAFAAGFLLEAAVGVVVSYVGGQLLRKKPAPPLVDNKPGTTSTRGTFLPLFTGRRRLAPSINWVGDRQTTTESPAAGGKGSTGSGSSQTVYWESAFHEVCIGPVQGLYKIWSNGKVVYAPNGGITPTSTPSGTSVTISGFGTFTVYWGEPDQGVDLFLAAGNRVGVASNWKYSLHFAWSGVRLGGFPTWPNIEYEVECKPFKPLNTMAVLYDAAPERLSSSVGWYNNTVGPNPSGIFNIIDAFSSAEAPSTGGVIKIAGSHIANFPANGKCKVTMPYVQFTNRLLTISASTYNSSEVWHTPSASPAWTQDALVSNIPTAAYTPVNVTVATSAVAPPAIVSPPSAYAITIGGSFPNTLTWNNALTTGGTIPNLSAYENRLSLWVYRFGVGTFTSLTLKLVPFSGATQHLHAVQFVFSAGATSVGTSTFGARGEITQTDANWKRFDLFYTTGHGSVPSTSAYELSFVIDFAGSSGAPIICNPSFSTDGGVTVTGVTTLDFVEPLTQVRPHVPYTVPATTPDTVQSYEQGYGPGGANAAHILDQYLFETFPHGVGLDRTQFDIPSLEAIGVALDTGGEGLRSHCLGDSGTEMSSLISDLCQDVGIMIAWDMQTSLYKFTLVRDPTGGTIPTIPFELISAPTPERMSVREQVSFDKLVYGFPDQTLGFHDNTVVIADDGRASVDQNQKADVIPIPTVIDAAAASQVAERRAQIQIANLAKYDLTVLRDGGNFYPGQVFYADGFEEVLRVIEVKPESTVRRTVLTVSPDSYTLDLAGTTLSDTFIPNNPDAPAPDAAVGLIEVPPSINKTTGRTISVLRIRSSAQVANAAIHISPDDLSYTQIEDYSLYVTGGTLLEDVASSSSDITTGPVILGLGPDVTSLSQTLSADDWALGRQLVVIGHEVFFLQEVVPLGDNMYRLDGLKRARYRSTYTSHSIGDTVFIVNPLRIEPLHDPLVKDGQTLYIKTQPNTPIDSVLLTEVTAVPITISASGPTVPQDFYAETPSGTINGSNTVFTLAYAPNPVGSLFLFRNGVYLTNTVDYNLSSTTITFVAGAIPQTGDSLLAAYYQA